MGDGVSPELIQKLVSLELSNSVIVHGGGPAVTNLSTRLGLEPRFITSPSGIRSRYTDWETMQAFIMAMKGKINTEIVIELQKLGIKAAGFSGADGPTLIAERKKRLLTLNDRGRKMMVDGGYTGKIVNVETTLLSSILDSGIIPVVSPIALSTENEPLNVDGDRAAAEIAGALHADELILLTNVDGVILDDSLVERISQENLPEIMKMVGNGMDKKLLAAKEAMEKGCKLVRIINGKYENTGNAGLMTGGTVISA